MKRPALLRLPYLPVILGPFILLAPVWLTGKGLFWGTPILQFHPWRVFAWRSLISGSLPLWNPLSGMGASLIANYQSALFYPPNWLYYGLAWLGGESWMAWGQAIIVALHLAVAGAGMARLGQELGLRVLSQTISGLAFGLSGYLVARAGFLSINAAVAWLPWVLWAVTRLVRHGWRNLPGVVIFMGLQLLSGHAQTAWYSLLLAGGWAGWLGWATPGAAHSQEKKDALDNLKPAVSWRTREAGLIRAWGLFGLAVAFAVALAAIQLFPTAELLGLSQRSGGANYDFVMTYSFWPWRFITLLAPNFFGNPAHGTYWGYANYWEDAVYVGLLPLFLALRALFGLKRTTRKAASPRSLEAGLIVFLWSVVLVSFLLALGKNTPVYPWLYAHIPTFNLFQAPTRFSIWAVVALALLAGLGADAWGRPSSRREKRWVGRGMAASGAVTLAAGATALFLPGVRSTFLSATALTGLFGMGVGGVTLLAPSPADRSAGGWRVWLVTAFVGVDLLVAGWGLNPGLPLDFFRSAPKETGVIRDELAGGRLYLPARTEYDLKFHRYFRFDTLEGDWETLRASLLPNLNLLDGLPTVNNFDPLLVGRYSRWMDALERMDFASREAMLNLMGVRGVERVDSDLSIAIRPLEGGRRFTWVPCARFVPDEESAWEKVTGGALDLNRQVILEGRPPARDRDCDPPGTGTTRPPVIRLLEEAPNRLVLRVQAERPGWLVVSDLWYPGWQARLGDEKITIYRANYLFRAVPVPPGTRDIEMIYHPRSFAFGLFLSGLAGIALLGVWMKVRNPA